MHNGMVFNIQKCSIHDGPGLRTLVFLKGCPLGCLWCANPESQRYETELTYSRIKCIGCGACLETCPRGCLSTSEQRVDFDRCDNCGKCVEVCHAQALTMVGEEKTAPALMDSILRDKAYYARSGGGVTFSGGEPLTQPTFLLDIANRCRDAGVHVVVETCGCGSYDDFAPALEYVDMVYFDLKCADPNRHRELTGVTNQAILRNLQAMDAVVPEMVIRIPLIPGCNDDEDNILALAEIIKPLKSVKQVEFMAYHNLGEGKYAILGRAYALKGVRPPADASVQDAAAIMNKALAGTGKRSFYEKVDSVNAQEEAVSIAPCAQF